MIEVEVISGAGGPDEALNAEHQRLQDEAEQFLAPLMPMLDSWHREMAVRGGKLRLRLLVGQYPGKGAGNPVKAGLWVSLSGPGIWHGGTVYTVEAYMPDELPWLAAEIENSIEEHLLDPEFGCLDEGIREMAFGHVQYDRPGDHEHCSCCGADIAISLESPESADAYVATTDPSYEIWLCARCYEYWAPRRNLNGR